MSDEMPHVIELAERIGPRPATTDSEAEAADYIQGVFEARGLEVTRQEFDTPRTYGWAYVLYHLLTITAVLASGLAPVRWWAFVLAIVVAVLMRFDLDTRFGLTAIMPKGPSQNLIARYVPRVGRNERARRVVVMAHYDSARSSLAFSPGMVRNFEATFGLMKWCTYLAPAFILFSALPWTQGWMPWTWYVSIAAVAYLVIPLLINTHRELLMKPVPGANDNASGVAVMLTLMRRIVPEPDAHAIKTGPISPVTRDEDAAWAADVVPEGSTLSYAPVGVPSASAPAPAWSGSADWSDDEDAWSETREAAPTAGQQAMPFVTPTAEQSEALFGTGSMPAVAPAGSGYSVTTASVLQTMPAAPVEGGAEGWSAETGAAGQDETSGRGDEDLQEPPGPPAGDQAPAVDEAALFGDEHDVPLGPPPKGEPIPERHGLLDGLFGGGHKSRSDRRGVRDWLGVSEDFDARKEGKSIGGWDELGEAEDSDETGWKGGAASIEDTDDPGFAASEAARIRRRVTSNPDRELLEKEVWFVATGAEEVGTYGARALIREFGHDLEDSFVINIDNVGAGAVVYVTSEGMATRYPSDRRILGAAKRVVRERQVDIRGRDYRGLSTDATPLLARGFRAMSVMAFDINGRLPNWHWRTDTPENCSEDTMAAATDFVAELIKEL